MLPSFIYFQIYFFFINLYFFRPIASIELYEGKTQTNSTIWSSLNAPPSPLVERQTYIISSSIAALRETITEKGITNKHVLSMHNYLLLFIVIRMIVCNKKK